MKSRRRRARAPGGVRVSGCSSSQARDCSDHGRGPFGTGYSGDGIDPVTNSSVTLFNELPQFLGWTPSRHEPLDFKRSSTDSRSGQRRFSQAYQFITSYAYSTANQPTSNFRHSATAVRKGGTWRGLRDSASQPESVDQQHVRTGFYDRPMLSSSAAATTFKGGRHIGRNRQIRRARRMGGI